MAGDGGSLTDEPVDSLLAALAKTPGADAGGPRRLVARGSVIDGQYEIVRSLGQGGMGVVYLARDLRLDRDVAIKLGHVVSAAALGRIGREAQALARLSHPNVVVIHQVGEVDGRLYIAMEHVDGGNAREWLAAEARTWRAIVALYCAAGDGLAAAHAAGFVHRDFKPDNVLVGGDGRPRVADFGLVRDFGSQDDAPPTIPGGGPRSTDSARTTDRMTETGAILGTPAYMAPEQLAGDDLDARADQFGFCAALWEALFGARPFRGRTPAEVAAAIDEGPPRAPADRRGVPRRLIAALRRGLDRDRAARWPSMSRLLAELRRDPRARRRIVAIAIGAALAAGGGAYALTRGAAADPCADGAARIATTWSPSRASALAAVFAKAGVGHSWASFAPILDRYASTWAGAHDRACRATRVDGSQSEAVMDRRMMCLTRARNQLDAVLEALASGDHGVLAGAASDLEALPDLDRCDDVAELANQAPLPADPAARVRIDAATSALDLAKMNTYDSTDRDPRATGDRVLRLAEQAGWPPLVAEATLERAELYANVLSGEDVAPDYEHAAELGLAANDEATAAMAIAQLAEIEAVLGHTSAADHLASVARGLWTKLGEPPELGVRIEGAVGLARYYANDTAGAVAAARRSSELSARAFPNNVYDQADNHSTLALALQRDGQDAAAYQEARTAVDMVERAAGPEHPIVAAYLDSAAQVAETTGHVDEAIAWARRSLAITTAWYGDRDPRIGNSLQALGLELSLHGDPEEARVVLERAVALASPTRKDDLDFVQVETSLEVVESRTGHHERAIELASAMIDRLTRVHGPSNEMLTASLITRGISERALGRYDDSRRDLARVVAIHSAVLGPDVPEAVNADIELSYTLVASHHAADAVAVLEAHVAAAARPEFVPSVAAELSYALADALWQSGGDRARARALAADSLAGFTKLGDPFTDERHRAESWLQAHPTR